MFIWVEYDAKGDARDDAKDDMKDDTKDDAKADMKVDAKDDAKAYIEVEHGLPNKKKGPGMDISTGGL